MNLLFFNGMPRVHFSKNYFTFGNNLNRKNLAINTLINFFADTYSILSNLLQTYHAKALCRLNNSRTDKIYSRKINEMKMACRTSHRDEKNAERFAEIKEENQWQEINK